MYVEIFCINRDKKSLVKIDSKQELSLFFAIQLGMSYHSYRKILSLAVIVLNLLPSAHADDNPFLRFDIQTINGTLSKNQTLSPLGQITQAPQGNGAVEEIPDFPTFTKIRMGLSLNGFAMSATDRNQIAVKLAKEKIPEIMQALDKEGLLEETVKLSRVFQIDPLHILGPIVGENSFNGFIDRTIQDSYHQMFQKSDIEKMSDRMATLVNQPETEKCLSAEISNYWKWRCVIYYSSSVNNSNGDLIRGFYSISKSGSFGLGQIQPFLLWSLNDIVAGKTKYQRFDIRNMEKPMRIIFNNKEMLAYVAANAVMSIQVYKLIAGVDISNNPGLTTTLYNVGDEYKRAYMLNQIRLRQPETMPQVNYMGWYVNTNDVKLRSYLKKYQK